MQPLETTGTARARGFRTKRQPGGDAAGTLDRPLAMAASLRAQVALSSAKTRLRGSRADAARRTGGVGRKMPPPTRGLTLGRRKLAAEETIAINHHLGKVQRQGWDAAGNRTWMSVDGIANSTATYEWDSRNRLAAIHHASMGDVAYSYNAAGQKTGMTYPNGILASYSYDAAGRIVNLDYRRAGNTPFFTETLTYDTRGNVTQRVDDEGTHQYQYDWLDQLTRVDYPDSSFEAFAYDKSANRSSLTTAGGTASYTVDDADQLLSVSGPGQSEITTFAWTPNGEMASKLASGQTTPTSYSWNTRGMITRVSLPAGGVLTYAYLPEQWLGSVLTSTRPTDQAVAVLWDERTHLPIADIRVASNSIAKYLVGRQLLAMNDLNGTQSLLTDSDESIRMGIASDGAVAFTSHYTALGAFRNGAQADSHNFAFGHYQALDANSYLTEYAPYLASLGRQARPVGLPGDFPSYSRNSAIFQRPDEALLSAFDVSGERGSVKCDPDTGNLSPPKVNAPKCYKDCVQAHEDAHYNDPLFQSACRALADCIARHPRDPGNRAGCLARYKKWDSDCGDDQEECTGYSAGASSCCDDTPVCDSCYKQRKYKCKQEQEGKGRHCGKHSQPCPPPNF